MSLSGCSDPAGFEEENPVLEALRCWISTLRFWLGLRRDPGELPASAREPKMSSERRMFSTSAAASLQGAWKLRLGVGGLFLSVRKL